MKSSGKWFVLGISLLLVLSFPLWRPLFVDDVVNEELPAPAVAMAMAMSDAAAPPTAAEIALQTIRLGSFVDGEGFYQTEGTATIYQLADGRRVLRLADFRTTNGPALHVYLASDADPQHRGELGRTLDLGALKGNVGDQNYEIPADIDLSLFNSVVIYCVPFERVFGYATLS